jgi:Ca2+:H+ antiporter
MGIFNRRAQPSRSTTVEDGPTSGINEKPSNTSSLPADSRHNGLPTHNGAGEYHGDGPGNRYSRKIKPEGESGRRGFNPKKFSKLTWKSASKASSLVNLLWPFVPAAIALHFISGNHHVWTFAINYIAMVPCANLLGYAGQEFARKLPKVAGILIETTLGSVVEIVLFMVLIVKDKPDAEPGHGNLEYVIQAAILGSILTNLLLCLGCCFLVGGIKHKEQTFHAVISEAGSGILLVAGFALLIPSAFFSALKGSTVSAGEAVDGEKVFTMARLQRDTANISHGVAIILMVAFCVYIAYNALSHDNLFNEVLESDVQRDRDHHRDLQKAKLTMTECILAIVVSLVLISMIAVFLVEEIEYIVREKHVPDNFLGLILVPLVEKAAEHLTAIDEAYDNQIVSA